MAYLVRKMKWEDIEQVRGIDLVCFPNMLPPTNYKTEFINPMAHYLVACDESQTSNEDTNQSNNRLITGFIGLWLMAGEIHIINLAVHPDFRREGIGELLLISAIELSMQLGAVLMTLEVRISNLAARALYLKYGFSERGIRRAYYLDNHEDAVIMTLDGILSNEYTEMFRKLKRLFENKGRLSSSQSAS